MRAYPSVWHPVVEHDGGVVSENSELNRLGIARSILLTILAVAFFLAGLAHFQLADAYAAIVPTWVPAPHFMVLFTGWCELFGAVALLIPRLRKLTGVMLAIFVICVFPANIRQALEHIPFGGHPVGWSFSAPRLAFQPVLVWWPLFCTQVIDWPWGKGARVLRR